MRCGMNTCNHAFNSLPSYDVKGILFGAIICVWSCPLRMQEQTTDVISFSLHLYQSVQCSIIRVCDLISSYCIYLQFLGAAVFVDNNTVSKMIADINLKVDQLLSSQPPNKSGCLVFGTSDMFVKWVIFCLTIENGVMIEYFGKDSS